MTKCSSIKHGACFDPELYMFLIQGPSFQKPDFGFGSNHSHTLADLPLLYPQTLLFHTDCTSTSSVAIKGSLHQISIELYFQNKQLCAQPPRELCN